MHLLSLFSMLAVPIPVVMYAETLFEFRWRYTSIVASIMSLILFLVTTILNALNIMDYHESMFLVHIMLFLSFGLMLYSIMRYLYQVFKKRVAFDEHVLFMIIGLVLIVLCGVADVFRFYTGQVLDPALFTRVGFLGTIICFVIASSRKIIDMFKLNTRLEFVTKLAYEDGLTGLYNRTSYNEKLQEFDEAGCSFGIVMFDINNLKQVNDNIGHDAGDELLVLSADMIQQAFQASGMTCFRVGGDEFVALVHTDNIEADCRNSISKLEQLYSEYNSDGSHSFDIVIAKGYYCYEPHKNISIERAAQMADKLMYQNKQELKQKEKE
jgi:diguanylate cyclase (GGDEF)-like protein